MSESNRDPARVEEERLVFEELKSRAVPYAFGWVQIRYDGELILFSEKAGADSFLGATDVFEAWPWSDAGFLLLRPAPVPGGAAGAAALVCGVGSLRPFSDLLSSWKARLAQTRRAGGLSSESVPSDALRTIREYLGRISRGLTRLAQVLLAGLEDRRGSDARPDRLPLALPLRALLVSWPGLAAAPEPLSPLRGGAGFRLRCLSALPTLGAKEQVSVPGAFRVRDTPRNLLEADRYLQYLLGLVLYEAVSTLSPVEFREEDGSVPVPVSFVVPEVNAVPAFGAWLMKLLAASPDHRFYSLEVAGRVLRSLFGEEAPPPARRYDLFVGLHEGMQKGAEHAREGKPVIQEDSLAVVNSLPSSEGGEERAENWVGAMPGRFRAWARSMVMRAADVVGDLRVDGPYPIRYWGVATDLELDESGLMAVVSDGVSTSGAGCWASHEITNGVVESFLEQDGPRPDLARMANDAVRRYRKWLQTVQHADPDGDGHPSATLCIGVVRPGNGPEEPTWLYTGNVGDSRIYLLRPFRRRPLVPQEDYLLQPLSVDDSMLAHRLQLRVTQPSGMGENIRALKGQDDASMLRYWVGSRTLDVDEEGGGSRGCASGSGEDCWTSRELVKSPPIQVRPGDVIVICSDGLSDLLDAGEISLEQVMLGTRPRGPSRRESPDRAVSRLVRNPDWEGRIGLVDGTEGNLWRAPAETLGGKDNLSVVAIMFHSTETVGDTLDSGGPARDGEPRRVPLTGSPATPRPVGAPRKETGVSRARAILRSALLTPRDQLGPVATADLLRVLCLIARETERPSPEILDRIGALCASLRQTLERPVGQATGQVQYARVQLIDAVLDASGHSDRARTFLPFALTELRNMEPGGWEVAAEGLGAGEDANLFPCYAAIFLKATRTQDRTTATFSAHWNTVLRRKALSIAMKIQDSPGTRVPVLERIGVVLMCDQLRIACRNAGDESQEREYAIWAATNAQHLISELRGPPVPPPRGMLTAIGQVEGLLTKEARGDLVAAMGKLDGHPEIWPRAPYADPWGPGFLDAAHYLRLSGSSLGQLLPPA